MENKNEQREMTQEELDKIVGGNIPGQPRTQETLPDITCPKCGIGVGIGVIDNVYSSALYCPKCGQKLNYTPTREKPTRL